MSIKKMMFVSVMVLLAALFVGGVWVFNMSASKASDTPVRVWVTTNDGSHTRSRFIYVDSEALTSFTNSSFERGPVFLEGLVGDPGEQQTKIFLNRDTILEILVVPPGTNPPIG